MPLFTYTLAYVISYSFSLDALIKNPFDSVLYETIRLFPPVASFRPFGIIFLTFIFLLSGGTYPENGWHGYNFHNYQQSRREEDYSRPGGDAYYTKLRGFTSQSCALMLPQKVTHRNTSLSARYWEDPEAFKPERFLEDWPRDAFWPFSGGARSCIGRRFSPLFFSLRLLLTIFTDSAKRNLWLSSPLSC